MVWIKPPKREDFYPSIVVDCGSFHSRAGFGGRREPTLTVPSVIGSDQRMFPCAEDWHRDRYIGEDALSHPKVPSHQMKLRSPYVLEPEQDWEPNNQKQGNKINNNAPPVDAVEGSSKQEIKPFSEYSPPPGGHVRSWDDVEALWHHLFFNELRVAPEDQPLFSANGCGDNSADNLEKFVQIMFETFNVPSIQLSTSTTNTAVLSLYAANGQETGTVIDCGHKATTVTPLHQGSAVFNAANPSAASSTPGGQFISSHLGTLVNPIEFSEFHSELATPIRVQWLSDPSFCLMKRSHLLAPLKAALCRVSAGRSDKEKEQDCCPPPVCQQFTLPDGHAIEVDGRAQLSPGEVLFEGAPRADDDAVVVGSNTPDAKKCGQPTHPLSSGLGSSVVRTLSTPEATRFRNELYQNIVLVGGGSQLPGLPERLKHEILLYLEEKGRSESSDNTSTSVSVKRARDPQNALWRGASIAAAFSDRGGGQNLPGQLNILKEQYDEVGPVVVHGHTA